MRKPLHHNGFRRVEAGYWLSFDSAAYLTAAGRTGCYPTVSVTFTLADPARHYHVPVLPSPFARER